MEFKFLNFLIGDADGICKNLFIKISFPIDLLFPLYEFSFLFFLELIVLIAFISFFLAEFLPKELL